MKEPPNYCACGEPLWSWSRACVSCVEKAKRRDLKRNPYVMMAKIEYGDDVSGVICGLQAEVASREGRLDQDTCRRMGLPEPTWECHLCGTLWQTERQAKICCTVEGWD